MVLLLKQDKLKAFVAQMKTVAPHTMHVHCIIHRQHLAAKNLGGNMAETLNTAISAINFIKTNSLNATLFQTFCDKEDFKKLLLHTEVRWLSKGNSLGRLVNMWKAVLDFLKFKSEDLFDSTTKQRESSKNFG